jgi:hypothetical protein
MEWWNIEDPPEEDLNIEIQKRMMALYQILIRAFIVRSDLNPLNPTFQYSNIDKAAKRRKKHKSKFSLAVISIG